MTLGEAQRKFARLVADLIVYAYDELGYEISFGEAYRTPEQAELNAKKGTGIKNSLHCKRLAVDLNLFKNGKYLTDSRDHAPLGTFWEALDPHCRWGGRFMDGNHYEFNPKGR